MDEKQKTKEPRIFISHAWQDKPIVRKLETALEAAGAKVWVDHSGIRSGESIPKSISDALGWCNTLLLVWSKDAEQSNWVQREWENALALNRTIIPCLLDDTHLPPILTSTSNLNFHDFDSGLARLLSDLNLAQHMTPTKPTEISYQDPITLDLERPKFLQRLYHLIHPLLRNRRNSILFSLGLVAIVIGIYYFAKKDIEKKEPDVRQEVSTSESFFAESIDQPIDNYVYPLDYPIIKNYLRVKGILKKESPIYSEPSINSQQIDKAKQFSIVFVFGAGKRAESVDGGFYRVGKEPDQAIGWIPKKVLREWGHRLVLHFSPLIGRQPALIYGTQNEVEDAVRSAAAPDRNRAIAEEPGDISANRYSMLMPVLSPLNVITNNQIRRAYKIVFLTGSEEAALLEIMFVLDATKNMQPYIDSTTRVISEISQRALSMREDGRTHIGLTCYRDYILNQPSMGYVTKEFFPLTSDYRQVKNMLKNKVREAPVLSEDVPEAAFDGLYAAITETNWDREKSSLRLIVWISDASGHPEGHKKNPMKYSLQQVMQTASDNRVRIIAIKIQSENRIDNMVHREQAQKLAEGLTAGDQGFFTEIEISPSMTEEYVKKVVADIETEIARLGRLISVSKATAPQQATLPSSNQTIIFNTLKPHDPGATSVEFSEGWIAERDHENHVQVKPYAFMAYDDLALNIFYLTTAQTLASSPTEKVFQAIAEAVHTQTGERWKESETLQAHYEKKFGLPATSDLLRFDPEELASWGEQRRADLIEAIKRKIKLMETHRDDPANWYKLGQRDFRYTFVPLEFLP
jgi:hypothetical protein